MKTLVSLAVVLLTLFSSPAWAALSASNIYQIQSTATASNVNGGGFNFANVNFMTDGAITSGTGTAPVLSSGTYSFVAGDVGAWIWLPVQTNINSGFYKIASVSAGAATLTASIGTASVYVLNRFIPSTVAGAATTSSPTGVTFGIDYSQQDTAAGADTDLASSTGTTAPATVTSVSHPFGPNMVGNLLHVNSGTSWTTGWYEIVSVSGTTATLDRAVGTAATLTSGTAKVGGALSLGSGDSTVFGATLGITSSTGSSHYFIKGNATYTISGTITETPSGNAGWPIVIEGFSVVRGDRPVDSSRPIFNVGTAVYTATTNWYHHSMQYTGTGTSTATGGVWFNCKFINTSTTAGRNAFLGGNTNFARGGEFVSYRGIAVAQTNNNNPAFQNFYIHDSDVGISLAGNSAPIFDTGIVANNVTAAISSTGPVNTQTVFKNLTLYGAEGKQGTGMNIFTGSAGFKLTNSIFYGFNTAVSVADVGTSIFSSHNDFYNNTTDVSDLTKYQKSASDLALDPQFVGLAQRTGSTATTTAGNHLIQTGATFLSWGVTPGRDFLYVKSGTGVTVGKYGILSVDSETQITTDIAITADATADVAWSITTGQNFAIGTNLKAAGVPAAFPGGYSTSFTDVGAVQRQEGGGISILGSCSSVY